MNRRKNGFINLLFEGGIQPNRQQQKQEKQIEIKRLQQFVEQNVFMPRNRVKNMRILKLNDSITINAQGKQIAKQLKKMFVDGSHLTELIPRRQLVTQNYQRNVEKDRMYSPQIKSRRDRNQYLFGHISESLYFQDEKEEPLNKQQKKEEKGQGNESRQFETVQIIKKEPDIKEEFVSLDCSTNSSSKTRIKQERSIRYRRVSHNQRKNNMCFSRDLESQDLSKRKATLELKKDLTKLYSNHFGNPENISSKAYIVLEHFKDQKYEKNPSKNVKIALNSKINLEIASLTKIMTLILTLQICQKYKIDVRKKQVVIGSFQTRIEGTSADLQTGQIYTIQQLFYGLMLPSGNDASIALAVFCGQLLESSKREPIKQAQMGGEIKCKKIYYKNFILEMNKKALILEMKRTFFSNSHGLPNMLNKSCAGDVALLVDYSLKNSQFKKVVGTQQYECQISYFLQNEGKWLKKRQDSKMGHKKMRWQNTHRYLHSKSQLYKGIKTGITQAAGPCLASLIEVQNRQFIIIVLGSKTQKWRYKDTESLRNWVFKKDNISYIEPE